MKKDGIHVTTATVVNVNGTNGSYHSLTSENKIGDMRGHLSYKECNNIDSGFKYCSHLGRKPMIVEEVNTKENLCIIKKLTF